MYFLENDLRNDLMLNSIKIEDRLNTLIPYTEDNKNFIFNIYLQGKKETIFFEF